VSEYVHRVTASGRFLRVEDVLPALVEELGRSAVQIWTGMFSARNGNKPEPSRDRRRTA